VTQRGATTLLEYALPIDHQADGLILTLSARAVFARKKETARELGLLRVFALPQSAATQCTGTGETFSMNGPR
jgi:hypothetical protein